MVLKLIGLQNLDFQTATGDEIHGVNLFCGFEDSNVEGLRTEKFFVNESFQLPADLKPGTVINADFNHKGKLTAISKISK